MSPMVVIYGPSVYLLIDIFAVADSDNLNNEG
jgi:hypothetical protein